jgi:hypothetical protein
VRQCPTRELCEQALDPDDPWAHSQKGWIALSQGATTKPSLNTSARFTGADNGPLQIIAQWLPPQ